MNTKSLASLITVENLQTIKVKFPNTDKLYTYKTINKSIQTDDFVVVSFNDVMVKIARVVEIDDVPDLTKDLDYKWIVQKVDFCEYKKLNDLEKETFTKLRRLENKALIDNAKLVLADKLNVDIDTLQKTIAP